MLRGSLVVLAVVALGAGGVSTAQAAGGIRELSGSGKASFIRDAGLDVKPRCIAVGVAKSDPRWAISSFTGKCGPHSGHNYVYRKNSKGTWKFLFYDMDNDGCDRFRMPTSVRADFAGYVC